MSSQTVPTVAAGRAGFVHQALAYGSEGEFLAATVPFVRAGLRHGEVVLAVTTLTNIGLLRQALGPDAARVEFVDAAGWYLQPARTLAAYDYYVNSRSSRSSGQVRVIGEPVWSGRVAAEITEWKRYESVLNVAFAQAAAWIICPYDRRVLHPDILADALRTHPELVVGDQGQHSAAYANPMAFAAECDRQPLPLPRAVTATLPFDGGNLWRLRRFVTRYARRVGLAEVRLQELVLSVNEVAANAIRHGGGHGTVRLWVEGGALVGEIADPGQWAVAGSPGYLPPDPAARSGVGLWVVRQLCDRVEIRAGSPGTTVRLRVAIGER